MTIGYSEEEEFGYYQEQDKGHCADQGKPSNLIHASIPVLVYACLYLF
jgi:hypothetical protein